MPARTTASCSTASRARGAARRSRPFVRAAALVLALVAGAGADVVAGGAAGASGQAAPSLIFGLRPTFAGLTSLAEGHFSYALPAGATVEDGVDVVNFTPGPLNINLYRANLNAAKGGGLAPGQLDDPPTGATSWLRLDQVDVVLAPNGFAVDRFRLRIPRGTPPGQYLAAVVGSRTGSPPGGGVRLQSRVALEVEVTVVGQLHTGLTVSPVDAHRSGGTEHLAVDVTNTGNTLVTLGGTVSVHPWFGHVATLRLGPRSIYVIPGGRATLTGTWSVLPFFGPAHVRASVAAFVNGAAKGTYGSGTLTLLFIPWLVILGTAIALLILVGLLFLTRRRRVAWRARRADERQMIKKYRAEQAAG